MSTLILRTCEEYQLEFDQAMAPKDKIASFTEARELDLNLW